MKIRCIDGKVRRFKVADNALHQMYGNADEAKCLECGFQFGCHDTKILKPEFRKHICKIQIFVGHEVM